MSKVKQIIERYFGRDQSESVQRNFFFWFKTSLSSQEKEESLFHLWEDFTVPADLSTERSFRQVEQRLGLNTRIQRRRLYLRIARIAAIFLIPVLSLLTAWLYVQNQPVAEVYLLECYAPAGEMRELTLPDKSTVLINSGSTLFYPKDFTGKTRNIYLHGEAKFTVSPDKKKPFIVQTNDMSVEALGTVFNVSSYPDNPHTTATLVEGQIGVGIRPANESFILEPGEQLVYEKETGAVLRKDHVRLDYVLAWEKGQLVFQGADLHTIVIELERRFGVTIYLNTTGLSDEKLTLKFLNDETLEEVLSVLQHVIPGFKFKIEGEKIYIY